MKPAEGRFSQRLRKRLQENLAAFEALETELGLDRHVIDRFRFGLSEAYPKPSASSRDKVHQDVLVAPLMGDDGIAYSRYVYWHLETVTIDNRIPAPRTWTAGESETYFSRKVQPGDSVIVCDNVAELWALVALIHDSTLDKSHVFIAPTRAGEWPAAWCNKEFWTHWKRVNILIPSEGGSGPSTGSDLDRRARELARHTCREVYRVPPHQAVNWLAARLGGIRFDVFHRLLKEAALIKPEDLRPDEAARYASAVCEDLSCSYERGFLFEAIQVLERSGTGEQPLERLMTVVIRSDRTLHRIEPMPHPPDTPKGQVAHRLMPDGALLARIPTPSSDATWRWPSIHAYLYAGGTSPPLATTLAKISDHLSASVWLPSPNDYILLSCIVAATFCQQIFDSVPLVLVTGPKASGKTELSIALSKLCANSPGPIGLISSATLTRLVDASHGFVAIDDLEKIMAKKGGDLQFSEFAQTLKLSYKKESALRMLTDVNQNNQLQRLNFFGIKLINNTRGVDEILGSRMLTINTRPMPAGATLAREGRLTAEQCAQLRDDLHVWAFTHVPQISRTYTEIYPNVSNREEEIFASVRVIARMSGSELLQLKVDEALHAVRPAALDSNADVMEEALLSIVAEATVDKNVLRTVLTVLEVQMRLQIRQGSKFGKSSTTDISDIESPEWIGRQFKTAFAPVDVEPVRLEMYGRGTRAWKLSDEVLEKALKIANVDRSKLTEVSDPRAFCVACACCDYQPICDMRARKQRAEVAARPRGRFAGGTPESPVEKSVENPQTGDPSVH